jgi:4-amino-4-deoxy-L-arabinose transferase-like glycosyltransferase
MVPTPSQCERWRWPWWVAGAAFVQYVVVGWWLLAVRHYAIADSLSRTLSAKLMVLSRDPHLGAVGFYWMPLPTLIRVPFVLVLQPFGRADLAGPLASATMAALTLPVLAAIGRTLRLSTPTIVAVVMIYAVSPVSVFLGANGMSESCAGFFLAVAVLGFLRWRHDGRLQSLVLTGIGLGGSAMSRYETIVLLPVVAVAVAICVELGRRRDAVVVALLPAVLVYGWWMLASQLIAGDWLFFYNTAKTTTARPDDAAWLPAAGESVVGHGLTLLAVLAPALVAVMIGAIAAWRRWRTSIALVAFTLAIPTFILFQVARGDSWGVPRFYMLTPLLVTVAVMWILRTGRTTLPNRLVGLVGVGLLAVGAGTSTWWFADQRRSYAEGEFGFFGAILGREGAEGAFDGDGPNRVFIDDLRPYRRLIQDLDPLLASGSVAAMDSLQAIPVLLTRHPGQFVVPEDRDFEEIMSDPLDRFEFIVVQTATARTEYRDLLDNALGLTDGGRWLSVADYDGLVTVYEWVPDGADPAFPQAQASAAP